jgi:hypothetical protein
MRFRVPLFIFLLAAGSLALPVVAHAMIPFFGPIIDSSWTVPNTVTGGVVQCALGWGAVITVINNIIEFLLTIVLLFVAPIMIAYSGFLLVVGQGNSGAISKAKGVLLNTIIGIVIALAGWLIVDALMAVLTTGTNGSTFARNWSSLITSGGALTCLPQKGVGTGLNQSTNGAGVTSAGVGPQVGKAPGPCSSGNTACSTSAIQQAAQTLNMTLSDAQATAMSCIAMTESSGNPDTPNSSTGACGTFQITTQPGNWSNSAYHQSPCSISSSCNDAQCNLQTALIMFGKQGYQPWTGKNPDGTYWNPNAVACVSQYGGS